MKAFTTALAAASVLLAANTVWAQRDAASKITGSAYEAPYFAGSAGAYQSGAYQQAVVLQQAASSGKPVPKEVAAETAGVIRKNLDAANKHYAGLRKLAKDDPAAIKLLDSIDAHHKKAAAMCGDLEAACAQGMGESGAVHDCCSTAASELKAAQGDHEKLMAHLKIAKPTATAKPAAKK